MRSTFLSSIFTLVTFTSIPFMHAGCGSASSGGISAVPATISGPYTQPRDAVPNSDGTTFYFTATTSGGAPAVFQVAAAGGQATIVKSGAPLAAPNSLAISSDDKTLFVTDGGGSGTIFALAVDGSSISALPGSLGTSPVGIEVGRKAGQPAADVIYFSGKNASSGRAALFSLRTTDSAPMTVLEGAPLANPGGVTVTQGGDVYVANVDDVARSRGCIYRIASGSATELACNLHFGTPSGITLNLAENTLLASGLDDTDHDQVYAINLATKEVAAVNNDIGQNTRAGGVHRARSVDVFSWSDLAAGSGGAVYRVTFR